MNGLLTRNKDVRMTASVAYGWAGVVTEVKWPFGVLLPCVTNRWTDGRMDGRTHPGPTE